MASKAATCYVCGLMRVLSVARGNEALLAGLICAAGRPLALGLIAFAVLSACSPAASQPVAPSTGSAYDADRQPLAVMARADKLAAQGQTEQALREYLWALDHGLEVDPAFTGVRNSFLIERIIKLGTAEPSALRELEARAARLEKAILTSRGAPVATFHDVMLYVSLNSE